MKSWAIIVTLLAVLPLFLSCQKATAGGESALDAKDMLAAVKIEMLIGPEGNPEEIEYHIPPADVPEAVKKAMDKLHPGGPFTGAEKEMNEGILYYELTREVGGLEAEAMFLPDGTLHQEEIEVAAGKVPEAVKAGAEKAVAGATVKKWEEIRDKDRKLFEYHVKMAKGDKHYKVMLGTDGTLLGVYREIPAEIEVKVP
jgi:hypothetical protein